MKTREEKLAWRTQRATDLQDKLSHAKTTKQNTGILEYAIKLNREGLDKLKANK